MLVLKNSAFICSIWYIPAPLDMSTKRYCGKSGVSLDFVYPEIEQPLSQ